MRTEDCVIAVNLTTDIVIRPSDNHFSGCFELFQPKKTKTYQEVGEKDMKGGGGGGGLSVTGKWRWRGLVIGVLFLVILSMLVHLAFLLGVRNGFHSPNPNGNVVLFAFGSVTSCCN